MTQSTPNASSLNGSEPPDTTQHMPTAGMHVGQFPWPQPGSIPHPGFYHPSPNVTHGATSQDAPVVAPLPGAGVGVAHHASSFPGGANPFAPPVQHQGLGLSTSVVPSLVPQAPGLSASEKRVAEDFGGCNVKRTKARSGGMKNDPLFKPMLDQHGQPDGKFVCSKDGMVLNPESYLKHIKTRKHLGYKLEKFKCPVCLRTYTRFDACKRHFYESKCKDSAVWGPPPSFLADQVPTSSAFVPPVMVPTMAFTYTYPYPMPATIAPPAACAPQSWGMPTFADPEPCLSQSPENKVAEPAEDDEDDDDDADFWDANELQDASEE